jgi:serine protease Do
MANEIMKQLIASGKVVRGWLGIVIQDLTDELASGFGVPPRSGVLVADVMRGSPAETAGLKPGDIIVEFAGDPIREVPDLQRKVAATPPGRPAALSVVRERQRARLEVKIGEMPGEETVVAAVPKEEGWGLTVAPVTPELAERHQLTTKEGVVVTAVTPDGAGDRAGIRPGDAILEVNRERITNLESFRRALARIPPSAIVPVYLQRGGGRHEYVVLKGSEAKP